MLTLINEKRKTYIWSLNILWMLTLIVSVINIFFEQHCQVLFLSTYSVLALVGFVALGLLLFNIYTNLPTRDWKDYVYWVFYLLDACNFFISFVMACVYQVFPLPSYLLLSALIFSLLRIVYFNATWTLNFR